MLLLRRGAGRLSRQAASNAVGARHRRPRCAAAMCSQAVAASTARAAVPSVATAASPGDGRPQKPLAFCSHPAASDAAAADATATTPSDPAAATTAPAPVTRMGCSTACATAAAKAKAMANALSPTPETAAALAAAAATPTASGSRTADPTFYRRPLPGTCVAFSAPEGRRLFAAALHEGGLKSYFPLAEHYVTQAEPAFCGLSTLSMCLNALGVDPGVRWKGVWRWYDEEVLVCCVPIEQFKESGMSFDEFASLARCNGVSVDEWRAEDTDLAHFRRLLEAVTLDDGGALADSCPFAAADAVSSGAVAVGGGGRGDGGDAAGRGEREGEGEGEEERMGAASSQEGSSNPTILVTSYDRRVLGQTGEGHFSPVAAYCPSRDKVLMMDVARFKYPPHWVDVGLLWEAMSAVNNWNNKSRGYFALQKLDVDSLHLQSQQGAASSGVTLIQRCATQDTHLERG